ncbi:hypothetical protein BUALT_Bualt01G0228500 [Buddleja alternifolia]|uniref:DUF4378 domain-containing protein n=1 Tax=Buddleja alternifolia TaxID=168488 RepID=A0AAV6YH32_9LAMI|nr:hypothetical protein BUALT_Bualt01G0228500 [Buddleja alternifolia]
MAKKSQRRPSRFERDQAGCISGLISIFDFRHGRSTRRLLADRRRVSKQGAGHSSIDTILPCPVEKFDNVVDAEESKMPITDFAKTSVKELMEEEMFNEQGSINPSNITEKGSEQIDSKYGHHMKNNHKRKNKISNKSTDMDNLDLETMIEELARFNQRNTKHDRHDDLDIPSGEAITVEEKLVAAVKMFIEQRMSKSKRFDEDGNPCYSKEFMDALQTLSSNKGSFLKLLKDQNSVLVKHLEESGSRPASEEKPVDLKSDDFSNRKNRNFFRRRSKSMDSYSSDKDCQSSNKIVILKPGPGRAQSPETNLQSHCMDDKMQNERNISQFSFTEIKRKLKHAMGKERQAISPDRLTLKLSPKHQNGEKCVTGENFGWSSPNRNHFFTERFTLSSPSFKKGEVGGKSKELEMVNGSNIYVEAKKHLSEILKNGDENAYSVTGKLPKSLGRILSLPEYNGSPCPSPRKHSDDIFITAQMRLSPRGTGKNNLSGLSQESHNNQATPSKQNLESQPRISGSNNDDKLQNIPLGDDQECYLEIQSSAETTIIPEVQSSSSIVVAIEEDEESRPHEEEKITNMSSSESSSGSITGDVKHGDTREVDNEESGSQFLNESSQCFNPDLFGGDQMLSTPTVSTPHSPVSREVEDSECAIDKMERPSPISVLEPLFTDDDVSPSSTISKPVEKEIQPRQIHFEEQSSTTDQGICTRISLEDEESPFEYVEAVLLGSGLNWDEFLSRWLALYEILDSSLFDEVELFSSRARHDQKLLFDCANEALKEVCESYFGCFTGIPRVKRTIRPVPKGMDLINEVWERVEWQLSQHPQPHSLDQLVKRDLARSRKWMNIQSDIEIFGFEMGEIIFDELVNDFVISFVDDISESEFEVPRADFDVKL